MTTELDSTRAYYHYKLATRRGFQSLSLEQVKKGLILKSSAHGTLHGGLFKLLIPILVKTITKFSNVICYHQPDLSTNRTVYTSRL